MKHAVETKSQKSFAIKIFDRLNQDFSAKLLEQEVPSFYWHLEYCPDMSIVFIATDHYRPSLQIETMKTLQHPNIVQFIDFYQDKKKAYLLLEL